MATWKKVALTINGVEVKALAPEIVSASRSTDIPAFYCDWFFDRLKKGYSVWTNPFNGVKSYVDYRHTRFIVFWSKNPRPLLKHLPYLKERNIGCYVQYSLNDYESEGLEKNVPPLARRIETFKLLVDQLGKGGVVWRFDPLVLTDGITIDCLLAKIENIGDQLQGCTEKLVFSFADVTGYRKVEKKLDEAHVPYREWTEAQMAQFARGLVDLNRRKGWGYQLATCGEAADFDGVAHNHCIDEALLIRRAHEDKLLMEFLKVKRFPVPQPGLFGEADVLPAGAILLGNGIYATCADIKDKGQREFCGCVKAKDVGQYNTCVHGCDYCYANDDKAVALRNYERHRKNPWGESVVEW